MEIRKTLILLLGFLPIMSFAQLNGVSFTFKNPTYSFVVDKIDTGKTVVKIPYQIKKNKDTLIQDYTLKFELDSELSNTKSVEFKDKIIELTRVKINESLRIEGELEIIIPNTILDTLFFFTLQVKCDSLSFDFSKHKSLVTYYSKRKYDLEQALGQTDKEAIGDLKLTATSGIKVYKFVPFSKRNGKSKKKVLKIGCDDVYTNKTLSSINTGTIKGNRFFDRYKYQDKGDSVEIDFVKTNIADGRFVSIVVFIKDDNGNNIGAYSNRGPVSITNLKNMMYYPLEYIGPSPELRNTVILTGEFLSYFPSGNRNFIPNDSQDTLSSNARQKMIYSNNSPKTFFDARVYTDTKGLSGENNGLVQTDLNGKFILNTTPLKRTYGTFLRYVSFGFSYSKFDSKFDTLNVPTFNSRTGAQVLNLMQNANTSYKVEVDLYQHSHTHEGYISIGHYLYTSKVRSLEDSTSRRIFTPSFYTVFGGSLYAGKRIRMDMRFVTQFIYNGDQSFLNYSNKVDIVLSPEIEVAINLKEPVDKRSAGISNPFVFGRIRYFDAPSYRGENFWQVQIGVQIPLTNFLSNKD